MRHVLPIIVALLFCAPLQATNFVQQSFVQACQGQCGVGVQQVHRQQFVVQQAPVYQQRVQFVQPRVQRVQVVQKRVVPQQRVIVQQQPQVRFVQQPVIVQQRVVRRRGLFGGFGGGGFFNDAGRFLLLREIFD